MTLPVTWYLCPACLALHLVRLRYVAAPRTPRLPVLPTRHPCPSCHRSWGDVEMSTEIRSIQEWERLADLSLQRAHERRAKAVKRQRRNTYIVAVLYLLALVIVVGFLT